MLVFLAILLLGHGLIHLLGVAKALAISPALGVLWLAAALLFVAASGAVLLWPRGWWAVAAAAIAVSTIVMVPSWAGAKAGALLNAVIAIAVIFGFLAYGPFSLRAAFEHDVDGGLARFTPGEIVEDTELARLPAPVQRYLRRAGVVGQPRVRNFHVRMHGRIRSSPVSPWMTLEAEQYNFVDEPARHFYLNASMFLIPVQGYHRFTGRSATMEVKAAALVTVARASGSEMTQSETVTMFNDMCVMAPATLLSSSVRWEGVDGSRARAAFTHGGRTINAELSFSDEGDLIDFWSDDRYELLPDGTVKRVRWSTPLGGYRSFGPVRLSAVGEGRWHEPDGEYAYIQLTLDDIRYNLTSR